MCVTIKTQTVIFLFYLQFYKSYLIVSQQEIALHQLLSFSCRNKMTKSFDNLRYTYSIHISAERISRLTD